MILLDTNVVSELMKAAPDETVARWAAAQPAAGLYTTSVTQAEILHGVFLLPAGKRRAAVEAVATAIFEEDFEGRILAFDSDAALPYARIAAERRRAGRPISQFDAQRQRFCGMRYQGRESVAALRTRKTRRPTRGRRRQGPFDPAVEDASAAEAERRNAEIESGAVTLIPGPEALAKLKAEFR